MAAKQTANTPLPPDTRGRSSGSPHDHSAIGCGTWQGSLKALSGLSVHNQRLGDVLIGALTEADVEDAFTQFTGLAASTWNKRLQAVLHMQRFGLPKGFLSRPWLTSESDLKRKKGARRERRLVADERNPETGQI